MFNYEKKKTKFDKKKVYTKKKDLANLTIFYI